MEGDDRPAADAKGAATGDAVEDVVARFAHGRRITGATTLEELGLGSLERIELALALERAFDCTIDEEDLARLADVDDLRGLLAGEPAGRATTVAARASSPDAGFETPMAFPTWSQHAASRGIRRLAQAAFLLPLTRVFAWIRVEGLDRLATRTIRCCTPPTTRA